HARRAARLRAPGDCRECRRWPRRARQITRYFSSSITTDFAGSVNASCPASALNAVNAAGATAAGLPNALMASIAAAVSTRPLTFDAVAPVTLIVTCALRAGSRFTIDTWYAPAAFFDADA